MTDFIVVGNKNAVIYKEVFPLFKDCKVRLGYTNPYFEELRGNGLTRWFVTFPVKKRPLTLTSTYDPDKYPKYDNYDAINVDRVKDIPYDYDGVMGVPITVLTYDLENFQIVDRLNVPVIGGGRIYKRVIIKKNFEIVGCDNADCLPEGRSGMSADFVKLYYEQGNTGKIEVGNRLRHYVDKNGKAKIPYLRILVKIVGMATGAREITGIPFTDTAIPVLGGGVQICKNVCTTKT